MPHGAAEDPAPGPSRSPKRRGKRRLIAALASTALCLCLLEGIGRIWAPAPPPPPRGMVVDELLGWGLPADARFMWHGREVTTNSLGLRGREPDPDAEGLRVLAVGDSSVFGFGLSDAQTFPAQLEELLRGAAPAQVVNGGVPGYTCPQSRALIRRIRDRVAPDVLVVYSQHSDVRVADERDVLYTPAHLGALAHLGVGRLVGWAALRIRTQRARPATLLAGYEGCIEGMVRDQQAAGGMALLALPVEVQDVEGPAWEHPGEPAGYRDPDDPEDEEFEDPLGPYREATARVSERTGSPLVDLPALFAGSGKDARTLFIDEIHPTAAGQALIASALRDALVDAGRFTPETPRDPDDRP